MCRYVSTVGGSVGGVTVAAAVAVLLTFQLGALLDRRQVAGLAMDGWPMRMPTHVVCQQISSKERVCIEMRSLSSLGLSISP